jgi:N-acetylglutamate synthase-like GNAT family acetyltransferase
MQPAGAPGPLIRDARADDAGTIARLLGQLGYPSAADAVEERLERLGVVGDRVVVAELDGNLVGLAHLQVTPAIERGRPVGKLGALVVDDERRGLGIGTALVEAVEAEARERGCEVLFVTTSERRDDAHAFYESVGFEQTGRRYSRTLSE